jgi:hypothetical protein
VKNLIMCASNSQSSEKRSKTQPRDRYGHNCGMREGKEGEDEEEEA